MDTGLTASLLGLDAARLRTDRTLHGHSPSQDDIKGLKELAELAGERFVRGVVLYLGDCVVPFGKNLRALPISQLWA